MNGKGSARRPEDRKAIEANWERVFRRLIDPIPGPGGVIGEGRRRQQRPRRATDVERRAPTR